MTRDVCPFHALYIDVCHAIRVYITVMVTLLLQRFRPFWSKNEETLKLLSPWALCILSGASTLIYANLGVEFLGCLPMPRRKALQGLHLFGGFKYDAMAEQDILQAVAECQQLRTLTISSTFYEWPAPWNVPKLDLRHLMHLSKFRLRGLPAPTDGMYLRQGQGKLQINIYHVTAWSKLWPQVQNHVHSITIEGWSFRSNHRRASAGLRGWPEGLDSFRGLQVLRAYCDQILPYMDEGLDLAHLAYIPHVALHSNTNLNVKISTGSWKVLELQSKKRFSVALTDAHAFMKSTGTFHFVFRRKYKPEPLIEEIQRARTGTGKPIYENHQDIKCSCKHCKYPNEHKSAPRKPHSMLQLTHLSSCQLSSRHKASMVGCFDCFSHLMQSL